MLYTGIDLHKRTVVIATVRCQTGKVHSEVSLPTSRSAVARYFHWLPEPTVATVERRRPGTGCEDLFEQQDVPLHAGACQVRQGHRLRQSEDGCGRCVDTGAVTPSRPDPTRP